MESLCIKFRMSSKLIQSRCAHCAALPRHAQPPDVIIQLCVYRIMFIGAKRLYELVGFFLNLSGRTVTGFVCLYLNNMALHRKFYILQNMYLNIWHIFYLYSSSLEISLHYSAASLSLLFLVRLSVYQFVCIIACLSFCPCLLVLPLLWTAP